MTAETKNGSKSGAGHHTLFMVGAIVLAFVVAWLFPHFAASLEMGGEIFLRLLTMVVVPLVMASVMSGILGLGDVRKLGRPGAAAVGYYISTTILAVTVGVIMVNLIRPGVGFEPPEREQAVVEVAEGALAVDGEMRDSSANPRQSDPKDWVEVTIDGKPHFLPAYEGVNTEPDIGTIFQGLVLMLFSDNLLHSMVDMQLLPLIVFSIIFAGMLTTMGEKGKTLTTLLVSINEALLSFVMLLMKFAPLGIFCLVTSRFGEAFAAGEFLDQLKQLSWYVATVLCGLGIHFFLVLPGLLWFFTKRNPYRFIRQMSDALLTAFSTASSSATLPVTMECAETKAGVSKQSTEFVLPLGATINMDGTALYQGVAAVFIAQLYGLDLTIAQQLTIVLTATLASIGTAGVPGVGMIMLVIVLQSVNIPLEGIAVILGVDRILDMCRTSCNITGDCMVCAVVASSEGAIESPEQVEARLNLPMDEDPREDGRLDR